MAPKKRKTITNEEENSWWGQHKHCAKADSIAAYVLIGLFLFKSFYKVLVDLYENHQINALMFTLSVFNYVGLVVHLLSFVLWCTLCFNLKSVHSFWAWKTWMSPALMPGGFAPRFGAGILGIILFISNTLISESLVPGYLLEWDYMWRASPVCRASFITLYPKDASFSKRFTRVAATGCYSPGKHSTQNSWLDRIRPAEVRAMGTAFQAYNTTAAYNSINPTAFKDGPPKHMVHPDPKINHDYQAFLDAHPHDKDPDSWYCNYQCMSWKEVAFNSLVSDLGMIFAGAAVVVGLVDSASASLGWHFVTEDTTIKTLKHLRDLSANFGWSPAPLRGLARTACELFHKSRCFCAIQLIALDFAARLCSKTVDVDGYYTVDFYVTMVLCQSLFFAVILRFWNPFTCAPVIFTKKMWTQGYDEFLDLTVDPPVLKRIDLYEWLHLTTIQRLQRVTIYARRVGLDSIQDRQNPIAASNEKDERDWVEVEDYLYSCVHFLHVLVSKILYCGRHELKSHKEKIKKATSIPVVCINSYEGVVSDIQEENGRRFVVKRKVKIPRETTGIVIGKTGDGKLKVMWDIYGGLEVDADPLYISQWDEKWKNFMNESGLAEDHELSESQTNKK